MTTPTVPDQEASQELNHRLWRDVDQIVTKAWQRFRPSKPVVIYEDGIVIAKPRPFFVRGPYDVWVDTFGSECRTLAPLGLWRWFAAGFGVVLGFLPALLTYLVVSSFTADPLRVYQAAGSVLATAGGLAWWQSPPLLRRYVPRLRPMWWVRRTKGDWTWHVDLKKGLVEETFEPFKDGFRQLSPVVAEPLLADYVRADMDMPEEMRQGLSRRIFTAENLYERLHSTTLQAFFKRHRAERSTWDLSIQIGQLVMSMGIVAGLVFLLRS